MISSIVSHVIQLRVIVVALVLADAMLEKFGGDSLDETRRNYEAYQKTIGPRGER